ncbi:unnamed protein product [Gongylonema pulchrum]|uniref:ANK_REP_REGION domain-containing protein n=1 Tax=Gongylonema pulchrum TaxID=637853 RepID=A0A183DRS5_9BILA|nr:unnamed protein product [Gongylonema pulchrum]
MKMQLKFVGFQMEQPVAQTTADASSTSAQSTRTSSVSPGVPKRRIPKVHKKNERGETPLHVAARKGEHRQCKKLIQDGALVDARDYAGLTPLHEACYHGHFKVARLLISWFGCCFIRVPIAIALTVMEDNRLIFAARNARASELSCFRPLFRIDVPDPSQPLAVSVPQPGAEKQFLISPSSDDTAASAEASAVKRENMGANDEESHDSPVDAEKNVAANTQIVGAVDNPVIKNEEIQDETQRNFEEIDSSSLRHPMWRESSASSLKIDESHVSPPGDTDEELVSSREPHEEIRFGNSESREAEIRRTGRSRGGARAERSSPSHTSQKTNCGEKRKQRGRKRGKGLTAATSSTSVSTHTSQPDDVYEFRSSPESDIGISVCRLLTSLQMH